MGQKTNPIGLRLGVNRTWDSIWFDEKNFADKLHEDIIIRNFISNKLKDANQQIKMTYWAGSFGFGIGTSPGNTDTSDFLGNAKWSPPVAFACPSGMLCVMFGQTDVRNDRRSEGHFFPL